MRFGDAIQQCSCRVTPETSITEAARLLREHKIGALPVVQNSELVGIITVTDVLAALTEQE